MSPVIFHIDVNSAYLSWTAVEQLKNGAKVDLREIPSIIGGDKKSRHGVVLAKSISAKKYGIRTGEPVVNAFRKCPNLVMEQPNHRMYREKSQKLMEYLRGFTGPVSLAAGCRVSDEKRDPEAVRLYGQYRDLGEQAAGKDGLGF